MLTVGLVALIFGIGAIIGFRMIWEHEQKKKELAERPEVYNPTDIIDKSLVAPALQDVSHGHIVSDFKLVDQYGDTVTSEIVQNKVFVVDYFFTTCPTICPKMSDQMERVQQAFKHDPELVILSHTVWPERDSIPVLKAYADKHLAKQGKWYFLTGDKPELYRMARESYFILKPAEVPGGGDGESDFIHTDQFVLVDQNRQVRGYYSGIDPEEVNKLIKDARYLLEHPAKR